MSINFFRYSALSCVALMLTAILFSCNGIAKKSGNNVDSVENEIDNVMPDTMFESVGDLDFDVEIIDTATSGVLNSLADLYDSVPGIFTFRGDQSRDARYFSGKVKGTPTKIVRDWVAKTAVRGKWGGGSGWTGQPVYVKWSDDQVEQFKKSSPEITANFKNEEIIVGSLCGEVYFIDFATGENSRSPLDVGNPVKGSVSLDPAMNGSLYVGHGIPENQPFGHIAVD